MDNLLIGVWNSDTGDQATTAVIGQVTMTFTKDGKLIYDIYESDKLQRMNLIYRISGDTLITGQPSHPQEEKTKFNLVNNDTLILEYGEARTKFKRKTP